jgi:hypothetical protein
MKGLLSFLHRPQNEDKPSVVCFSGATPSGTQESDGQSATCHVPAIVGQHFAIGDISPVITLIERLWI